MSKKPDNPQDWHRISPLSSVFFIFGFVEKIAAQALPGLIVVFAGLATTDVVKRDNVFRGMAVLLVIGAGMGILAWLRFRYRVTDDRVLLRKGVLHREELNIEFSRVQNVTIKEPFYMRPFGLAVLGIDTAGSSGKEISIAGIRKTLARELRETIMKGAAPAAEHSADQSAEATGAREPNLLVALTRRDVVIYGLTANFLLWLVVAFGAVFGAGDLSERLVDWLAANLRLEDVLATVQAYGGILLVGLLIFFAVLLAAILLPLISVIGALLRYDGYRLTVEGETYRKSSGLLNKHDESLKRHKIQAVVWKQNAVALFFKRVNLQLRQASAGSGIEQGQLPTGSKASFLVPALHPPQANDLSGEFLPGCIPDSAELSSVDRRRFMIFNLGVPLLPLTAAVLVPTVLFSWKFLLAWLLVALVLWWVADKRWQKLGYGVAGEYGFVRSGLIGSFTTMFPLFKIQRVDVRQTPLQHRKGLAHLTIHLASHSLKIPYVTTRDAYRIRDLALYCAESTDRTWY